MDEAHDLHGHCVTHLKNFPLFSQEGSKNPVVSVKLFHAFGAGTWYITEYDPDEKRAFGYVTGLGTDEWGYISIEELALIRIGSAAPPSIEIDLYFNACRFATLAI